MINKVVSNIKNAKEKMVRNHLNLDQNSTGLTLRNWANSDGFPCINAFKDSKVFSLTKEATNNTNIRSAMANLFFKGNVSIFKRNRIMLF